MNVYDLHNEELIKAFKEKNYDLLKQISSNSIFLIPVKDKNNIDKIAFESMMDSNKDCYLPLFIKMADMKAAPLIKGKQILIAHFGMIELILKNHPKLKGIVINPCTMDYKINMTESFEICNLYHKNEKKLDFNVEFYKPESFTMADFKKGSITINSELILTVTNYLKTTSIKNAYVKTTKVGNKTHYNFMITYSKIEQSFIDELTHIISKQISELESFEINSTKNGSIKKAIRYLKPIYEKK